MKIRANQFGSSIVTFRTWFWFVLIHSSVNQDLDKHPTLYIFYSYPKRFYFRHGSNHILQKTTQQVVVFLSPAHLQHCAPTGLRTQNEGRSCPCSSNHSNQPDIQWIGLRENLQESPIFNGKIFGFRWKFSRENQSIETREFCCPTPVTPCHPQQ